MNDFHAGDAVEILVNDSVIDRGIIRSVVQNLETGSVIVTIDWEKAGRLTQLVGELRKRVVQRPPP